LPDRITLSRAKGWRMPENTVKVDRSTIWGNPFRVGEAHYPTASIAVARFRAALTQSPAPAPDSHMGRILARLPELRGKNLACWCRTGEPCHADVLLELANR
jgi:hypothetical protein